MTRVTASFIVKPFDQLTEEQKTALAGMEITAKGEVKIKMEDKQSAAREINRTCGFTEDVKVIQPFNLLLNLGGEGNKPEKTGR